MMMTGQPLPDFKLSDGQGVAVTNADLLGHWTVLFAYPKDNTPGCTQESCDFRDRYSSLQGKGVRVLGISRDSQTSHAKFSTKFGLPFPLLSDPDAALLKPLGAFGLKKMYGKEVEGILRSTYLIDPAGIIRHVWGKVSVKGHVEDVLSKIEALGL